MSPSETTLRDLQIPAPVIDVPDDYLHAEQTLSSWFFTTDHKRIGILYLVSITLFFVLGSLAAGLVRLALVVPDGEILTNDVYNRMFTLHGVIMVWFFLVPSIPNTLGNFLLPLMIGAKDVAFPRLNLLSWYIFVLGSLFTVLDMLWGGVDTGWTFYTPLSTQYSNSYVIAAVLGVIVVGILVNPHRLEFHGNDTQATRPGHDLVPAAVVRLGTLRYKSDPSYGDPGLDHRAGAVVRRPSIRIVRVRSRQWR